MNTKQKVETQGFGIVDRVSRWVRPEIRALEAYHVPDAAGLVKLDAMENPYHWPEEMLQDWLTILHDAELNRYPPSAERLKARLSEFIDLPPGMDLILGNGSDELIQIVQLAVAGMGRRILVPAPTFAMYEMIGAFVGMEFIEVPLDDGFGLDLAAMLDAIDRYQPAIIFLAYPNNPTGNLFDRSAVERLLRATEGLVVLDEAYYPFAGESFVPRLGEFDNLLVMRTVSKLGLAGLRLGMMAGPREWLTEFDKVRLPYNINILTQLSAEFALRNRTTLDHQVAIIRAERGRLARALSRLPNITVFPSRSNFILFRVTSASAGSVFNALRGRGVLVKNLHQPDTVLNGCLRVTVGRPEENDAFLGALEKTL